MDIEFFRALVEFGVKDEPICILRQNETLLVCREIKNKFSDLSEIPQGRFVTGWQDSSGLFGNWVEWNSVTQLQAEQIPEKAQFDIGSFFGDQTDLQWNSSISRSDFILKVEQMKKDMLEGQYFLANLTRTLHVNKSVDSNFVAMLSCLQHETPFRFFMHVEDTSVLGLSPERFIKIKDDLVYCEPMKGTSESETDLSNSEKEFNENTMMIDLVRSELSLICNPDTVEMTQRNLITKHPGLVQMSSKLSGKLNLNLGVAEAIKMIMPIASVTGTPKPYVVKKIGEYEPVDRGIYCGAYGWIDTAANQCDLAVAIRTIVMNETGTFFGTGAGITTDSIAEEEWAETELKASRIKSLVQSPNETLPKGVFTSLRITPEKKFFELDAHCERLSRHAKKIGINIGPSEIKRSTIEFVKGNQPSKNSYLRISIDLADTNKTVHVETQEMDTFNSDVIVGISPFFGSNIVDTPKLLDRASYDSALRVAQTLSDHEIDDALLVIDGQITETTRANIMLRFGDEIVVPSLDSGMIRGVACSVIEARLEATGKPITRRFVSLKDLANSDEIITTNSVRGVQRVSMISSHILDQNVQFKNENNLLFDFATSIFENSIS